MIKGLVVRISSKCNNPGGDWHPERGGLNLRNKLIALSMGNLLMGNFCRSLRCLAPKTSREVWQIGPNDENGGTLGMGTPWIINPICTLYHARYLLGPWVPFFKGSQQQGGKVKQRAGARALHSKGVFSPFYLYNDSEKNLLEKTWTFVQIGGQIDIQSTKDTPLLW